MCGFVGFAGRAAGPERVPLGRMNDALAHRGPDDEGCWWAEDRCVGLAHRRLAVIDLSPAASQPMVDGEAGLALVYNGEIYNFRDLRRRLEGAGQRFRSQSDTEVLLAAYRAWGDDFVRHLDGMFAFALYDEPRRRLILGRDRVGEKPLFWARREGRLFFASELKAFLADPAFPRRIDHEALEHFLAFGYVPGDLCILEWVRKLLPGHTLVYDLDADEVAVEAYWRLPPPGADRDVDAGELVTELETLLEGAVARQLVADVPVGILLSGGIDSSLVATLAARVSRTPVTTFTITFPGHGGHDEGPYARLVADHLGTRHVELAAEPALASRLPELAAHFDEPLGDSSLVPTALVAALVRSRATVALGGDGGDELFGGYAHYRLLRQREALRSRIPAPLRWGTGALADRLLPVGFRGRHFLTGLARDPAAAIPHATLLFDATARRRLLRHSRASGVRPEAYKESLANGSAGMLDRATRTDFATYLPDDILVKVDRASMLASLEVRAPWLDRSVVEFAFGRVPARLKIEGGQGKVLSRRLAERLLPAELDLERKQGFSLPLASWLQGTWGTYMEEVLRDPGEDLFDPDAVATLLRGQRRGRSNSERLFALTMFVLWRRAYGVSA